MNRLYAADIIVSPDGKDIHQALREAREMRRLNKIALDEAIHIRIKGGIYALDEPLFIRPEDSGTESGPTIIEAFGDGKPILSGGMKIANLKKEKRFITAQIPEFNGNPINFRQIWVNGKKAIRARNVSDFDKMDRILSIDKERQILWVPKKSVEKIKNSPNAELILHQMWEIAVLRIKNIIFSGDSAGISFHNPDSRMEFEHPWPPPLLKEGFNSAFYLTNAAELLDEPCEWFFDRKAQKIYYLSEKGDDSYNLDITIPALENIVIIAGTRERPVTNVFFKGISFQHSSWLRPSEKGHIPLQAGMYLLDAYKLRPPGAPSNANKGIENQAWIGRPPAAVIVKNAQKIEFSGCTFEHCGSAGIDFEEGIYNSIIEGCTFRDIAGNGIQCGKFADSAMESHLPYNPEDERELCMNITIAENLITDIGNEDWGTCGVAAGMVRNCRIVHNEIYNIPYTGISLGWAWTKSENSMRDNLVEGNYIHHYARHCYDVAGIYTLSSQRGTLITENRIDSIFHPPYAHSPEHWFYLYTDEGSSYITVTNNWCPEEKFLQNANGPGNIWKNNGPMVSDEIKNRAGKLTK
jgi:hypothetical protein